MNEISSRVGRNVFFMMLFFFMPGFAAAGELEQELSSLLIAAGSEEGGRDIERDSGPDLATLHALATDKGVVGVHGSSFSFIDEGPENYAIIHETFGVRSEYKAITPIIGVTAEAIFIDCSYVRSVMDTDVVSVGSYCRGRSEASPELLSDAISDRNMLTYSSQLPWLARIEPGLECPQAQGLEYDGVRVVRCQDGDDNGATINVSVHVTSSAGKMLVSMKGFEFSPLRIEEVGYMVFWRLADSGHVIIHQPLPRQ